MIISKRVYATEFLIDFHLTQEPLAASFSSKSTETISKVPLFDHKGAELFQNQARPLTMEVGPESNIFSPHSFWTYAANTHAKSPQGEAGVRRKILRIQYSFSCLLFCNL